ncbi:DUF298 domain protein [Penicillium frequentans]|uniref:Defective in cullin neddylation protein n=1 Tax=Penicillium frequentans TaxID=3151616 RepID=A0AAD6CKM5_9EURO|nr:DUF298 domain protein [Penicillium glabrum]KAJ5537152.1 DUF298 domain protein [Penicillium glabrum]
MHRGINTTPSGPPLTEGQKETLKQFLEIAATRSSTAVEYLRKTKFDLGRAINMYYMDENKGNKALVAPLTKVFESYRDPDTDEEDQFGIDGAMKYFQDLEVALDEIVVLGVAELCQCPAMGEFTKEGFLNGWKLVGCSTISQMRKHIQTLRKEIPEQPTVFRRVYRYSFLLSRLQGQRGVQFEIAAEQWRLFFDESSGGIKGNTETSPWLDWWLEYMEKRGTKVISKDLWEQLEVFLRKALEDENLDFWDADAAWPGLIDEFVDFVKEKRGGTLKVV